ncbi:XRE family transcriptional regulator [Streptomyces sp. KPB2]|nr:XRE family transcriptional regulator [Streptomyces sp. KPB2]QKW65946.1 helix-turn-helix transcriptional regulator [Streptomyces sp. NA03103]
MVGAARPPADGTAELPFAPLAKHLIALRRAARLDQRTLAQVANISRGAVQRAERGLAAPTPTVLDAYVRACSGSRNDHARAHVLRARGRTAQRDRLRHLDAPAPALIHTADDLGAALAAAYERAGAPPLSDARFTAGRTPLPRTTAWRIVKRRKLPPTAEQLVTFLTVCGIDAPGQRPYIAAYQRITAAFDARPTPPHVRRMTRSGGLGRSGPVMFTPRRLRPQELASNAASLAQYLPPEALRRVFEAVMHYWGEEAARNGTFLPELHLADWATEFPSLLLIRSADGRMTSHELRGDERSSMQDAATG